MYGACNQYWIKQDSIEHVAHLVSEIYPTIRESILASKVEGEGARAARGSGPGGIQWRRIRAATPEASQEEQALHQQAEISTIINLSNEMLRNGVDATKTPSTSKPMLSAIDHNMIDSTRVS